MPEPLRVLVGILSVGLLVGALMASLSAFALLGQVLWPRACGAARTALAAHPRASLLLGLGNAVLFLVLLVTLRDTPLKVPLVLLGGAFYLWLLVAGLPGMLSLLGTRLGGLAGREPDPFRATVLGTVTLCLAGILPWLGQALLLGLLLATLGASLRALLRR